jgi:hypothetical protein
VQRRDPGKRPVLHPGGGAPLRSPLALLTGLVALLALPTGATALALPSSGSPLVVKPPAARKFPGVKSTQYDSPVAWTWRCKADSDTSPLTVTLRWEVDPRPLPAYSKGGSAPFTFMPRAKSFIVRVATSCEVHKQIRVTQPLPQTARLKVRASGNTPAGDGFLQLTLRGGFRNPQGNAAPFHLGVTFAQSSRTLLDPRLCSWNQTAFLLAVGKGVGCWW